MSNSGKVGVLRSMSPDRWLAVVALAFAVLLIGVWVPFDTQSGIVGVARRRVLIGDSLGPSVAGGFIALGAVLCWINPRSGQTICRENLVWIVRLLGVFIVSICIMRYLGPLMAWGLTDIDYRVLRTTPPWKYIGFVCGGAMLVGGLAILVKGHVTARLVIVAVLSAVLIALLYDLVFSFIQLPPNGDY